MPSPISIIVTATGQRLDVLPDATVEMNMGGISLLSLADRTATYTNTFKLPRTPVNEQAFGFASIPSRSNKVSLAVTISKGLFSRTATLKVDSFDTDYSCTVSFVDVLSIIKGGGIPGQYEYLYNMIDLGIYLGGDAAMITNLRDPVLATSSVVYLETDQQIVPSANINSKSLFVLLSTVLDDISVAYGITINGTLLAEADFIAAYLCMTNLRIFKTGFHYYTAVTSGQNQVTDLIKEIALLFFCTVDFSGTTITLNKVNFSGTPISVDGFTFSKSTVSGLAESNYVKYTLCKSIMDKYYGSDVITADGEGVKDVVTLKTYMPAASSEWDPANSVYGLMELYTDTEATNKIIIGTSAVLPIDTTVTFLGTPHNFQYGVDPDSYAFLMYSLSGYYSTLLDPIFLAPVILEATGWLDPITANNLMTSRLLLSRQLQGLYWVDSMAYDLTSGRTKMKLIKLPQ